MRTEQPSLRLHNDKCIYRTHGRYEDDEDPVISLRSTGIESTTGPRANRPDLTEPDRIASKRTITYHNTTHPHHSKGETHFKTDRQLRV